MKVVIIGAGFGGIAAAIELRRHGFEDVEIVERGPALEGAEEFAGHSFHSSLWDHDYDLRGKRVAVIGTGASAIQLIPPVADRAERLYVFQRTGNWFLPRNNQPYPRFIRWLIKRVPGLQWYRRTFIYQYGKPLTLM